MSEKERLKGPALINLKNRVAQGFNESHWRELGVLTDTLELVTGHHRLLRSLSWHDDDYEGHVLTVLKDIIDASDDNLSLVFEYVSKHCPEAGEEVSSHEQDGRRIVFSPAVFKVPDAEVNPWLVSVMMPFDSSMTAVYESIKVAAASTGYKCLRADDIWDDSTVIQDVFSLIFESYIVVCDFTGKNPNVFYEAGIAHTLGKHVVPITQHAADIPFDLRHHRYVEYLNNDQGRESLQESLMSRFDNLATKQPHALRR